MLNMRQKRKGTDEEGIYNGGDNRDMVPAPWHTLKASTACGERWIRGGTAEGIGKRDTTG